MMLNTTNTYEEVHAQLKGSIIAGDKNGDGVKVGDIVKVSRRKDLYKIHKIIQVSQGNDGEPIPIYELDPLHHQTIFRGEDQIELA
jgi:hypothetical protein